MAVWLNFWWKIGYIATEQLQGEMESNCFIKKKEEGKLETSLVRENGL